MTFDTTLPHPSDALSLVELTLYHQIMDYRAEQGLGAIPLSLGLTTTAGRHAADTLFNIREAGLQLPSGANLHSWSDAPYFSDHSQASIMWEAPQRIGTSYPGAGFEISASGYGDTGAALAGWKGSSGHDAVIVNDGIWANQTWNAIGIGVEMHATLGRIYHVWFGREVDPDGSGPIRGTGSADAIRGTAFDDAIHGRGAADVIDAAAGHDRIRGGGGGDDLDGGAGRDRLLGMKGNDVLSGGGGRDVLIGGTGKDNLIGGAGSDLFLFKAARFGTDRITDYSGDRVRIRAEGEATTQGALVDALSQRGDDVIYDHGNDGQNRIILEGVTLAELDLSLFDLG